MKKLCPDCNEEFEVDKWTSKRTRCLNCTNSRYLHVSDQEPNYFRMMDEELGFKHKRLVMKQLKKQKNLRKAERENFQQ